MCEEQIKEAVARRYAQWLSCLPEKQKLEDDPVELSRNGCIREFLANAKKLGLIK